MPAPLRVRDLTDEERLAIERLARSRKAATRLTERARIIWYSSRGELVDADRRGPRHCAHTVRRWIKRFNQRGWPGWRTPLAGRPPTYTPEEVAEVIAAALTDPQTLGLPFALLDAGPAGGVPQRAEGHRRSSAPHRARSWSPKG